MDDTNAQPSPQLLTDITFDVVRKGYDPGQVDELLERIAVAVGQMQERLRQSSAAAEAAERRAADAGRAQSALQARITELENAVPAAPPAPSPEIEAEQAASVLALAQRTADAVLADARAAAARMVTDAEAESSSILAAAQARAEASITDLDDRRRRISAEIDALSVFMDEQRAVLAADLALISAMLDDPSALRVAPIPVGADATEEDAVDASDEFGTVPSSDLPTMAVPVVGAEADTADPAEDPELVEADTEEPAAAPPAEETPTPIRPTTIFDVEQTEDRLFGDEDDAADEAMRRFFDADFDDDDRFGR